MNKHAGKIIDLIIDRIQKYGPKAAVVGGGLAGVSHLIAMNNQRNEEQAEKEKENTLYIDIPKTAGIFDTPTMPQYLLDSGLAVGTTLAAGGLGYAVVDSILKNVRKKKSEEELEGVKSQYSHLLTQKIYDKDENSKHASQVEFENIEALALSIYDAVKNAPVEKIASDETMGTLMTSLPGVGALITGILAHNYWYNREKDIETGMLKSEAENTKRSPALIKLRTVDENEEEKQAAFTPSNILAGTLGSEFAELDNVEEKAKPEDKKKKKNKKINISKSISNIDGNTSVIETEDGDVQINATDAASKSKLNKYKKEIAKNVLLALNTESYK